MLIPPSGHEPEYPFAADTDPAMAPVHLPIDGWVLLPSPLELE